MLTARVALQPPALGGHGGPRSARRRGPGQRPQPLDARSGGDLARLRGAGPRLNALAGFGGQVSLGMGAFLGTGAYAATLLMIHASVPYPVAMAIAAGAAGLLALVISVPLLRLRGDYFSVGTLAVTLALEALALNWPYAGRSQGLAAPVALLPNSISLYRLAVALAAVSSLVTVWLQQSRFGLRLMAVRDDEVAATGLGVFAFWHRLVIFVVSSALTGLVGDLVVLQQISFEATGILSINWTIDSLLMTVIGGMGTFVGPILGAVLLDLGVNSVLAGLQSHGLVIEGLLLIAIVRFAPRGCGRSPLRWGPRGCAASADVGRTGWCREPTGLGTMRGEAVRCRRPCPGGRGARREVERCRERSRPRSISSPLTTRSTSPQPG